MIPWYSWRMRQDKRTEKLTVFHVSTLSRQNSEMHDSKFPVPILTHHPPVMRTQRLSGKAVVPTESWEGQRAEPACYKEGMAVTHDPHCPSRKADSGYCTAGEKTGAQESEKQSQGLC